MNTNQEQNRNEISKANSIPIVNCVPSSCNVPKQELRKEIKEKLSDPNNPTENGDINKTIPKVSAPKSLYPIQVFKKTTHVGDQKESANQIKKYLDVASIISNLKFWNSTPTYNTDIQTVYSKIILSNINLAISYIYIYIGYEQYSSSKCKDCTYSKQIITIINNNWP